MKYYKIIQNNNFIGIANSNKFIAYSDRNHMFIGADTETGDLVECNDKLYRDLWMKPFNKNITKRYEMAEIIEITEEEYMTFYNAILKKEVIEVEYEKVEPVKYIPQLFEPEYGIDYIREIKLTEMSYECHKIIENGFDFKNKHFSLTTQDQLNLMDLNMLADILEEIPYHADGEEVAMYSAAEIKQIAAKATQFKIYHTTYFNSLKNYINSLETIEEIAAVTYGMEIPEEYKTEVLKTLEV